MCALAIALAAMWRPEDKSVTPMFAGAPNCLAVFGWDAKGEGGMEGGREGRRRQRSRPTHVDAGVFMVFFTCSHCGLARGANSG